MGAIIKRTINFTARADVFFYALLWLMFLLVIGTLAQKNIGLHLAQERYFSSIILWIGDVIPVPGAYPTMGLIFISLLSKMLSDKWTLKNSGTIITHIGGLLLLLGGFITAMFSVEGNMVIKEGDKSSFFSDYFNVEIAISSDGKDIHTFSENEIYESNKLTHQSLPFNMEVVQYCRNCAVERTEGIVKLQKLPLAKEYEMNVAGAIVNISGLEEEQDGRYTMVDFIPPVRTLKKDGKEYTIEIRNKRTYLPFSIALLDFEKQVHPGTSMAKSYKSEVVLEDAGSSWRSLVQMNEPLRYKGYTFFQSSFIQGEEEATVLAVVHNYGRLFPYISSIIMCIGLLIHLFQRLPYLLKKRTLQSLLILSAVLTAPSANAIENFSAFQEVEIQHDGRIKPLDTFARAQLTTFYGKSSIADLSASQWLAELLFDQKSAYIRRSFNISNPQIVSTLGLKWSPEHRYSFVVIFVALQKKNEELTKIAGKREEERTLLEVQLLDLHNKALSYFEISRSFSLLQNEFKIENEKLATDLGLPQGEAFDYFKMMSARSMYIKLIENLEGTNKSNLTPYEQELLELGYALRRIGEDKKSQILRVIPNQWENSNGEWTSPWSTLESGQGSPETSARLQIWKDVAKAYTSNNEALWIESTAQLKSQNIKIKAENTYNKFDPFTVSLGLYIASFIILLASTLWLKPLLYKVSNTALITGMLTHLAGISTRMWIMDRPPVATLYESILFVSLIAVIFAYIIERKRRDSAGILIGSIIGGVLLFIAMRYSAEGDSMGMLIAVLDTNFWLATHVVTITMGYGCAIVAGILAHIYLFQRLNKSSTSKLNETIKNMMGVALVALFFSVLGTILGGIWADQSWGRFWGWDPKENGAMLLCLWLIALVHGKVAGTLQPLTLAIMMALTNIVVALAWFGVNLLNVGLHSYGFTENIATNLTLFCLAELSFIIVFCTFILKQEKS